MNDVLPPDAALAAEIAHLKTAYPQTRELYREVCALLFFRYGITPTANRLYQLVRKGSMGTPTEVLAEFWTALREKSRVRIEHPDLPAELQSATGELAAALWTRAVEVAQDGLAAARHEAQLAVADAQARQATAEAECARLRQELTGSAVALDAARHQVGGLEQALAAATATGATLQDQLREAQQAEDRLQRALERARHDFATEVDKLRADGALAQERLRAAEARALLEMDRERGVAARLQKDLDAAARRAEQHDARQRAEAETLRGQLGDARHQAGLLQGRLDAVEATGAAYVREIDSLQQRLAAAPAATAALAGRGRLPRRGGTAKPSTVPLLRQRRAKGPGA